MELNNNLQILIERAWALHDEISDKIHENTISFCRFCSEHGHCCGVTKTPLERESLIAIRDSLKNVEDMLLFLQRMNSWQQKDRYVALTGLEESRVILMEKVTQYQGREIGVVEELNSCFADTETTCDWNLKRMIEKMTQPTGKKGNSEFFMHCVWRLINPWNWHKTARVAVELVLVSATISSTFKFCRTRQECSNSRRKIISFVDSATARKQDFLLTASRQTLDVFHGRG